MYSANFAFCILRFAFSYNTPPTIISHLNQDVKNKFSEVLKIGALYKKYLYILCNLYIAIMKILCYNIVTGKEGTSQCTTKVQTHKDSA